MKRDVPTGWISITIFYWGMRIFDANGDFIGRAYFEGEVEGLPETVTLLYPDGSRKSHKRKNVEHSVRNKFWICQPDDPAVSQRWKSKVLAAESLPGQSFEDGHALGVQEAERGLDSWTRPPGWIYETEEPPRLTGDDFNDGFITGLGTTNYKLVSKKFKSHPRPEEVEKDWKNQRFGVDPTDLKQITSFQMGFELAQKEERWLPRLEADIQSDEVIQERILKGMPTHPLAFRFGFLSGMESKFPNRY